MSKEAAFNGDAEEVDKPKLPKGKKKSAKKRRPGYKRNVFSAMLSRSLDNAIERCFRHIANGRRNWLHAGSHEAAENLAFMYSLYESCKMNELDFGRYIEDILTRMKDGDKDYLSMLPCYYKTPKIQVEECA